MKSPTSDRLQFSAVESHARSHTLFARSLARSLAWLLDWLVVVTGYKEEDDDSISCGCRSDGSADKMGCSMVG